MTAWIRSLKTNLSVVKGNSRKGKIKAKTGGVQKSPLLEVFYNWGLGMRVGGLNLLDQATRMNPVSFSSLRVSFPKQGESHTSEGMTQLQAVRQPYYT